MTIKGLHQQLFEFYAHPARRGTTGRMLARDLAGVAGDAVRRHETRLIIIDDVHFLHPGTENGEKVANELKWLANEYPATFLFAGVALKQRGLFSEGLNGQLAALAQTGRRWTLLRLNAFDPLTATGAPVWRDTLLGIEQRLVLAKMRPGTLADKLSDYLYVRSTGVVGSLMQLIRLGAVRAIRTGCTRCDSEARERCPTCGPNVTDLRRLPFRVRPLPDEPLDSWLETMAAAYHVTFGQMIAALGLSGPLAVPEDQHYSVGRLNRWMFHLAEGPLERVTHATGLPAAALQATTRSAFAATVTKYTLKGRLSIQCPTAGTQGRFCPECLLDSAGRWRLSWTYAFVATCPRHRRVLSDICPTCGTPPRARPLPVYLVPRPGHCQNRPRDASDPRQRCGTDLRTETGRVEASAGMLAAQRAQFATISQGFGRFGIYQDDPQPAPLVMEDVRTISRIAVRALVSGGDIDVGDIPTATLGKALDEENALLKERPRTSALASVGATLAFQAMRDPDQLFTLLHGRIPPSAVFDRHSIQLELIVARSRGRNMRHLTRIQRLVPPPPGGAEHRARKLPAQLWPDWAVRLRLPKIDPELAASALSAAVVIAGTRLSHANALAILASTLDPNRVRDVTRLLPDNDPDKNLLLPIARLAVHLDRKQTPVDYVRRRALDYTSLLTAAEWDAIASRVNIHRGGAPRIRQVRLLLYTWLSGNHPSQAPQAFRPNSAADVVVARALNNSLSPILERELLSVSQQFLEARGIEEPVRWSPPLAVADWNPLVDDAEHAAAWPTTKPAREHLRTTFTFDELVEEYRSGRSLKELANDAGVGRSVMSRVLKEAGIELRPAHAPRRLDIDDERLRAEYQGGRSLEELARERGCGESTVANRLRSLDVHLRPRGGDPRIPAEARTPSDSGICVR